MSSTVATPRKRALPLRAVGFLVFLFYFFRALVLSNIQLAAVVLFKKREDIVPGFLTYPIEGLTKLEVLVLTHCITLTPGTTSVEISPDFTTLTVHALDASDVEGIVEGIRNDFEIPIQRWSR